MYILRIFFAKTQTLQTWQSRKNPRSFCLYGRRIFIPGWGNWGKTIIWEIVSLPRCAPDLTFLVSTQPISRPRKWRRKKDFKRPWLVFFPWHFGHCCVVSSFFCFRVAISDKGKWREGGGGRRRIIQFNFLPPSPCLTSEVFAEKRNNLRVRIAFLTFRFAQKRGKTIAHLI